MTRNTVRGLHFAVPEHHRSLLLNPLAIAALDRDKEVRAAAASLHRAKALEIEIGGAVSNVSAQAAELAESLRAGTQVDVRGLAAVSAEKTARADALQLIQMAHNELSRDLGTAISAAVPKVRRAMTKDVHEIIETARSAGITPTDADPAAAVAAGRAEKYQLLNELGARYGQAYAVWHPLYEAAGGGASIRLTNEPVRALIRLSNAGELVDHIGLSVFGFVTHHEGSSTQHHMPWPDPSDDAAWVAWLATSDGVPWYPSPREINEAWEVVRGLMSEASSAAHGKMRIGSQRSTERLGAVAQKFIPQRGRLPDGTEVSPSPENIMIG